MWWSRNRAPAYAGATSRAAGATSRAAGATLLCLLLAGCGFQLRGEPEVGIKSLFVPGPGVAQEIRRALATGPTKVVPNPSDAEASLAVLGEARDKRVHTITGAGRVYEFELRLVVRYEMKMPGRELPVIPPTELIARRIITHSESAPVAKEAEELLLFKDMQVEVADRILRQVAVARRDM
jgi:LPS-assembly lipoprotein